MRRSGLHYRAASRSGVDFEDVDQPMPAVAETAVVAKVAARSSQVLDQVDVLAGLPRELRRSIELSGHLTSVYYGRHCFRFVLPDNRRKGVP
jgi:hypothetical protein